MVCPPHRIIRSSPPERRISPGGGWSSPRGLASWVRPITSEIAPPHSLVFCGGAPRPPWDFGEPCPVNRVFSGAQETPVFPPAENTSVSLSGSPPPTKGFPEPPSPSCCPSPFPGEEVFFCGAPKAVLTQQGGHTIIFFPPRDIFCSPGGAKKGPFLGGGP